MQSTPPDVFFSFLFFPCCSQSGGAGGGGWGCDEACLIPEIQDSESREPTAPSPGAPAGHFLQILCNHNVFRVKRLFKGESHMNWAVALNTKERCHHRRLVRAGGRYPILESMSE